MSRNKTANAKYSLIFAFCIHTRIYIANIFLIMAIPITSANFFKKINLNKSQKKKRKYIYKSIKKLIKANLIYNTYPTTLKSDKASKIQFDYSLSHSVKKHSQPPFRNLTFNSKL